MTAPPFERIVRYLQRTASRPDAAGSDGELLERFVAQRDAAAFEMLMRRHAPLVWGVCRRLLHEEHDAEDAFQATFLVLLRKAGSLERRSSLGSWLYGVAFRVSGNARKARAVAARHRQARTPVADLPPAGLTEPSDWQELRPLLDEELHRLPEKYRAPLVLCCLQGKTNEQAAHELGWPSGSMSRRLARGRELLRQRLVRRGVALSVGSLATLMTQHGAVAAPPALVSGTIQMAQTLVFSGQAATAGVAPASVTALTEGVLKTMYLSNLKLVAGLLAGLALLVGTGLLAHQALADKPPTPPVADPAAPPKAPDTVVLTTKDRLTPQSFAQFHQLIQPEPGEYRWDEIDWLASIWHARRKAAAENKPIFIFGTQGAGFNDPLGNC